MKNGHFLTGVAVLLWGARSPLRRGRRSDRHTEISAFGVVGDGSLGGTQRSAAEIPSF